MRMRILASIGIIAAAAVLAGAPARSPARAASLSLGVAPQTQTVAPGSTFTVTVMQTSDATTTAGEVTVTFDPAVAQLQDVQPGPAYAAAAMAFGVTPGGATGGEAGQPLTAADAIAQANQTGVLLNATAVLQPGAGTVPPGDNPFLVLTMQAAAAGTSPIKLSGAQNSQGQVYPIQFLDDKFVTIDASSTDGQIVVAAGAPPPPPAAGGSPAPAATPGAASTSPTAATTGASPTPSTGVLAASKAPNTLTSASFAIAPDTLKVAKEAEFSFDVTQQVDGAATSAQAKLSFDRKLIEIVKVQPGSGWKADSSSLSGAVTDANNSGELNVTLSADKTNPPPATGTSTLVTVTARGKQGQQGTTDIKLMAADVTGASGSVDVKSSNGKVTVGSAGGSNTLLIAIGLAAVLVVAAAGGGVFWMRRAKAS